MGAAHPFRAGVKRGSRKRRCCCFQPDGHLPRAPGRLRLRHSPGGDIEKCRAPALTCGMCSARRAVSCGKPPLPRTTPWFATMSSGTPLWSTRTPETLPLSFAMPIRLVSRNRGIPSLNTLSARRRRRPGQARDGCHAGGSCGREGAAGAVPPHESLSGLNGSSS